MLYKLCLMEAYEVLAVWGFSPLKHNIVVCFTFFLCFPYPGSLMVDNYISCGLIS